MRVAQGSFATAFFSPASSERDEEKRRRRGGEIKWKGRQPGNKRNKPSDTTHTSHEKIICNCQLLSLHSNWLSVASGLEREREENLK